MKESTIKFDLPENILTEAKKKYGFLKGVLAFFGWAGHIFLHLFA